MHRCETGRDGEGLLILWYSYGNKDFYVMVVAICVTYLRTNAVFSP